MHETSLVKFTLDAVEQRALVYNIHHVKSIQLVIGEMRGAIPTLMQEAFKLLTYRRPVFEGTVLEITEKQVTIRCKDCGHVFHVDDFHDVVCPECGGKKYDIVTGNELYIESFEGDNNYEGVDGTGNSQGK